MNKVYKIFNSFLFLILLAFSTLISCSVDVDVAKNNKEAETSETFADYVGTWNSCDESIVIDKSGNVSLKSKDVKGKITAEDNGFTCTFTEDGVTKTCLFTDVEEGVVSSADLDSNGKVLYFAKQTNSGSVVDLKGIWTEPNGTEVIIDSESKKICIIIEENQILGTYTQEGNVFTFKDEEGTVLGSGFVSESGNVYFNNASSDMYEIYSKKDTGDSDIIIPVKSYKITDIPEEGVWRSVAIFTYCAPDNQVSMKYGTVTNGTLAFTLDSDEQITHCILVGIGEDGDSEMPSVRTIEDVEDCFSNRSEHLDLTSGTAVFEKFVDSKEEYYGEYHEEVYEESDPSHTYTITNVSNWWGDAGAVSYAKLTSDEGNLWVEANYDSDEQTITFTTSFNFDSCIVCRFASDVVPEKIELDLYESSELYNRSVVLIMDGNNSAVFANESDNIADTNTIYFRDENSWRYNGDKKVYATLSSSQTEDTETVEMKIFNESWLCYVVDYAKYDTVSFSGNGESTVSLEMTKNKIFYRPGSSGKVGGKYKLYAYTNTTEDVD